MGEHVPAQDNVNKLSSKRSVIHFCSLPESFLLPDNHLMTFWQIQNATSPPRAGDHILESSLPSRSFGSCFYKLLMMTEGPPSHPPGLVISDQLLNNGDHTLDS